jgi:hypothetical protein
MSAQCRCAVGQLEGLNPDGLPEDISGLLAVGVSDFLDHILHGKRLHPPHEQVYIHWEYARREIGDPCSSDVRVHVHGLQAADFVAAEEGRAVVFELVMAVASEVVMSVAFGLVMAVAFGPVMVVAFGLVMAVAFGLVMAVAFGLVMAVAFGLVMAVAFGLVMAVAFGLVMAVAFELVMAVASEPVMTVPLDDSSVQTGMPEGDRWEGQSWNVWTMFLPVCLAECSACS